jgi:Nucleotidyl transferase AbiEii toxin, Type IV TA system
MFKRPHHQRIAQVLAALDSALLEQAQCYFAGGTAIVLLLDEYRESLDIDFLCASNAGYRLLRNTVTHELGPLLTQPIRHLREVRADRYGIRTTLEVDGVPIKLEIVSEGRIAIEGGFDPVLKVPTLSRIDMFAEKLLANADRGQDKSVMSRDIIDLAMMMAQWGPIPLPAWEKAELAYGAHLGRAYAQALALVRDEDYLAGCLRKMQMDVGLAGRVLQVLMDYSVPG